MKPIIAAVFLGLMLVAAQMPAVAKGRRQQQSATTAQDAAQKKAVNDAYQAALKFIPDGKANTKTDPWGNMR